MKKIVYVSNSGFTKEYAKLLAKNLKLEFMPLNRYLQKANKKDEVIFLSWVCISKISSLNVILNKCKVTNIIAVGLNSDSAENYNNLIKRNGINTKKYAFYYLRGGFNKANLSFIQKILISILRFILSFKKSKTKADIELLENITNGANFVKESNLKDIIFNLK